MELQPIPTEWNRKGGYYLNLILKFKMHSEMTTKGGLPIQCQITSIFAVIPPDLSHWNMPHKLKPPESLAVGFRTALRRYGAVSPRVSICFISPLKAPFFRRPPARPSLEIYVHPPTADLRTKKN